MVEKRRPATTLVVRTTTAVRWPEMDGEEDEKLLREEKPAMEEVEPAASDPATEGSSHGSPSPVEVEGTLGTRNGEEMGGEQPDLELRSRAVNNGGNGPSSSSPRDFNLDEFLTLAHKVLDHGDSQAMEALNDLKRRWEARFGIEKPRLPAESLDEHPFARELKQVCRRRHNTGDDESWNRNGCDISASTGCAWENNHSSSSSAGGFAQQQPKPSLGGGFEYLEPDLAGGFAQQRREPTFAGGLHSSIANLPLPSPAALHNSNENQLSPATAGSPTKNDVCNIADMDATVDNVGADVAGKVSDMEACLEHNADISPSRADIIAAARADIITDVRADIIAAARADIIAAARADIIAASRADIIAASRADIIAAARADIIADTGASRADVSNYTIKARADIIDDTRKARADISTDTCKK
ncbi:UNVERIFIED_CONTAM: hypothetical protein Sindi_2324300 [Sesamum indicum]